MLNVKISETYIIQKIILLINIIILLENKDINIITLEINNTNVMYGIIFTIIYYIVLVTIKNNKKIYNGITQETNTILNEEKKISERKGIIGIFKELINKKEIITNINTSKKDNNVEVVIEGIKKIEMQLILIINYISGLLLILINDIFSMYITLELYSISIYMILYLYYNKTIQKNKNIKSFAIFYFIISTISSLIILIGIYIIYKNNGIMNIKELKLFELNNLFIILGILFKIGAAPLHYWVVSLYKKVEIKITMFLSIIPKYIYFFLLLKLLNFNFGYNIFFLLVIFCFFSLLLGSIFGHKNINIIDILANSSILNVGYFLLGVLFIYRYTYIPLSEEIYNTGIKLQIMLNNDNVLGGIEIINFIILYIINTINIFLFLFLYFNFYNKPKLSNFNFNFFKYSPLILSLSLFSFIGFPPLAGFFAKWNILSLYFNVPNNYLFDVSSYKTNNMIFLLLLLICIISILLSTGYYLKFIQYFFLFFNSNSNISTTQSINSLFLSHILPINTSFYLAFTSLILLLYPLYIPIINPILIFFI